MQDGISAEEAGAWLRKHLASAPERDELWYRRVLNIYGAPADSTEPLVPEAPAA
ncbi:hypothetical protein [Streptomyces himalayensis]|uniref:Uncharacterized protein n=1 Tax=Streptomyces himalayensis subsp. himalayensis TaxID=2756131 RepID=A0A7W0IDL0_9ACTN|nr:hypothetical protein [Streptomyces himalayensis]MBA2951407.1 hypothetical protein [Streptomyces himalayensis subsp. himalayensis]